MKDLLEILNYKTDVSEKGTALDVYSIQNRDGSPRWVFPAHVKKPLFLKFYHVEGLRSRVFALLSKIIFLFGIQSFVYRKETWNLNPAVPENLLAHNLLQTQWALFTGTAGPNNKLVLYSEKESGSCFMKIPATKRAAEIVEREQAGTQKAAAILPESFQVPAIKMHDNGILEMEDMSKNGKRTNIFSDKHKCFLNEMYLKTAQLEAPAKVKCLNENARYLAVAQMKSDPRIPENLLFKLKQLEKELRYIPVLSALGHGDFTPWNIFEKQDILSVYDWELASDDYPLGFDAFHFVIQKGIMIERKSWKEIRKEIETNVVPWFKTLISGTGTDWENYLKLYLFVNISKHLDIYMRQEQWHDQVYWLMQTWNEALSDVIAYNGNARGLLINDIFSMLRNKSYATIKFPVIPAHSLSPYSDIDICIGHSESKELVNRLMQHPLVQKVMQTKSSFMSQVQIILINNEILNLDLIWQLKWKQMVMMDVTAVLERAQTNAYGIKAMHPFDLKQYLGLFYGLNNAKVPQKYEHHLSLDTEQYSFVNSLIESAHKQNIIPQKDLMETLKKQPSNKGLNAIKNKLSYLFDTVYKLFNRRGMIVTFSGVDGAGKSTIIERVRHEYDKKLRRRVVVLRHRPSVLPILSAWTKGKAQAEQDSANTLPRQGTNQSVVSSLLRFAYYYTDYLLGQFVVYLRHVLRGDIVLYDRYYFDFINDSVRSNIRLPERFLRAGYFFLIKPDFNFFLYADADTILARKQELDKDTIKVLTRKYLKLFNTLGRSKRASERYIAIENKYLDVTINQIIKRTTGKAA